jgi:hypothetical protein
VASDDFAVSRLDAAISVMVLVNQKWNINFPVNAEACPYIASRNSCLRKSGFRIPVTDSVHDL